MRNPFSRVGTTVFFALIAFAQHAIAADVTMESEYLRRLKVSQAIQPHGETPFGEQLNAYTGDLTFSQTDIVVEGIGPTISLVRELASFQETEDRLMPHAFGNWTLSIPRIETLTRAAAGTGAIGPPGELWTIAASTDPNRYARCSRFNRPYFSPPALIDPDSIWNGMDFVSERGGHQMILYRAQNVDAPAMNNQNGDPILFPAITLQNWQVGCLSQTDNGELGEAFFIVAPDGTKYWLNYLVGERANTIYEYADRGIVRQGRMLATMYVSRVEDRFGNWLVYGYAGDRLTTISASDGRAVTITWRTDARLIDNITVQPNAAPSRVWRYEYGSPTGAAQLTGVVLPDGSRWSFDLHGLGGHPVTSDSMSQCGTRSWPQIPGQAQVSTVTHPSGLTGKFSVAPTVHARSYVDGYCMPDPAQQTVGTEAIPPLFGTQSLVRKEFFGPGIPTRIWTYGYSTAAGSTIEDACASTNTCSETRTVSMASPEGNRTLYTYSNRWGAHEGKLLKTDYYQGPSTWLRSEVYTYAAPTQGPYPSRLGTSMLGWKSNNARNETWTPQLQLVTTQQSRTFVWQVANDCETGASLCFDQFARPTKVTKSSAPAP